jgi:glutamate formiminotransferase
LSGAPVPGSEPALFEAVPNFSEGRDPALIGALGAGPAVLDVHADPHHHRCVVTMAFAHPERLLETLLERIALAVERVDLRRHVGVHPRVGAADVIPIVPLGGASMDDAVALARELGERVWRRLRLPVYFYAEAAGGRRLADIRAGRTPAPDLGRDPHPTAGACCIGARAPLVAYNLTYTDLDPGSVGEAARRMRGLPGVQALAFALPDGRVQLSMNLTRPDRIGAARAHEEAMRLTGRRGEPELVGLCPASAAGPGCDGGLLEARLAATAARRASARAAAAGTEELRRLAVRLEAEAGALAALPARQEALLGGAERVLALARVLRAAGLAEPEPMAMLLVAANGLRRALTPATTVRHARRAALLERGLHDGAAVPGPTPGPPAPDLRTSAPLGSGGAEGDTGR